MFHINYFCILPLPGCYNFAMTIKLLDMGKCLKPCILSSENLGAKCEIGSQRICCPVFPIARLRLSLLSSSTPFPFQTMEYNFPRLHYQSSSYTNDMTILVVLDLLNNLPQFIPCKGRSPALFNQLFNQLDHIY